MALRKEVNLRGAELSFGVYHNCQMLRHVSALSEREAPRWNLAVLHVATGR